MDRQTNHFEDGHIVFTTQVDGKTIEIDGDVKDIELAVDQFESIYDWRTRRTDTSAYLTFKPDEHGVQLTWRVHENKGTEVTHRATIVATDRTVAAFEKARKRVGAPKDAKIRVGNFMRDDAYAAVEGSPQAIEIEFIWKETV